MHCFLGSVPKGDAEAAPKAWQLASRAKSVALGWKLRVVSRRVRLFSRLTETSFGGFLEYFGLLLPTYRPSVHPVYSCTAKFILHLLTHLSLSKYGGVLPASASSRAIVTVVDIDGGSFVLSLSSSAKMVTMIGWWDLAMAVSCFNGLARVSCPATHTRTSITPFRFPRSGAVFLYL